MPPPKWKTEQVPSHKFEFINIHDFHSSSAWTRLRYTFVWIMFFKAILVFCGDIWTCTILIISGSWTSAIQPTIDLSIARWIFTGCILLSFLLLAMDFKKANKVIKSQDISYAVSNEIVSGFYCLQKFDYFCFIEQIRNSSKVHDKLSFFVFFQLKGWKHLVVQAPRQVINIMTLIAFMKALGHDLTNLDDIAQILPGLRNADKFTLCVMIFTSLMFVISGIATWFAILLWIPLVTKVQGNLKEYVCHKMDKRIDAIIKKTTRERARKVQLLEEQSRQEEIENLRKGGSGGGGGGRGSGGGGGRCNGGGGSSKKSLGDGAATTRRPKPTLPDIDVILANTADEVRLPARAYQAKPHPHHQHHQHHHQGHAQHLLHQHRHQHPQYAHQQGYQYPQPPVELSPVQQQHPIHGQNPYHTQHSHFQRSSPRLTPASTIASTSSPYGPTPHSHLQSSGRTIASTYTPSTHLQSSSTHSLPYEHAVGDSPTLSQKTPIRQTSMASIRTDGSSPILYQRSIMSRVSTSRRRDLSSSQLQQMYQRRTPIPSQHHQQEQQQQQESAQQHPLQPVQNLSYHDSTPHSHFQRSHTNDPEHWPAHYGFTTEGGSPSDTPSSSEHFSVYRPDSGVLPDMNDPYYRRMTQSRGGVAQEGVEEEEGEGVGGSGGRVSHNTSIGNRSKTYQPDSTELEQYDHLYKEMTETHLRVKSHRTLSIRSRSSRYSTSVGSVSPEPSYAKSLRQQYLEQHDRPHSQQQHHHQQHSSPQLRHQHSNASYSSDHQSSSLYGTQHTSGGGSSSTRQYYLRQSSSVSSFEHSPVASSAHFQPYSRGQSHTIEDYIHHKPSTAAKDTVITANNATETEERPVSVLDPPHALFMGARSASSLSLQYLATDSAASSTTSLPLCKADEGPLRPASPATSQRSFSRTASRVGSNPYGSMAVTGGGSEVLRGASMESLRTKPSLENLRTYSPSISGSHLHSRPMSPMVLNNASVTALSPPPPPPPPPPPLPPLPQLLGKQELPEDFIPPPPPPCPLPDPPKSTGTNTTTVRKYPLPPLPPALTMDPSFLRIEDVIEDISSTLETCFPGPLSPLSPVASMPPPKTPPPLRTARSASRPSVSKPGTPRLKGDVSAASPLQLPQEFSYFSNPHGGGLGSWDDNSRFKVEVKTPPLPLAIQKDDSTRVKVEVTDDYYESRVSTSSYRPLKDDDHVHHPLYQASPQNFENSFPCPAPPSLPRPSLRDEKDLYSFEHPVLQHPTDREQHDKGENEEDENLELKAPLSMAHLASSLRASMEGTTRPNVTTPLQ